MVVAVIYVASLLFGVGIFTFENVRDAAEESIQDKDRAKQVVAITEQADEEFESFTENVEKLSKQLAQMNKDYNMTREEMDSFTIKANKNRKAFLDKYVELRFQMKDLITAEEWQAMHVKKED